MDIAQTSQDMGTGLWRQNAYYVDAYKLFNLQKLPLILILKRLQKFYEEINRPDDDIWRQGATDPSVLTTLKPNIQYYRFLRMNTLNEHNNEKK